MSSQIVGSNQIAFNFTQPIAYGIGQTQPLPIPLVFRSLYRTYGTLIDQCNLIHSKTYTFVASTPQLIDLKSLLDAVGVTIALARVRLLAVRVNSQTDGQVLLLGANGANDWLGLSSTGSTVTVYPSSPQNDGFAVWQMPNTTGAPVGSSTHLLKADPGSNAFTVDILIAGCDA
jgi:hypothetical protein